MEVYWRQFQCKDHELRDNMVAKVIEETK